MMRTNLKRLLVAGIPLYIAVLMTIAISPFVVQRFTATSGIVHAIFEPLRELWGLTYIFSFIAILIPREFLLAIRVFECREDWDGWCQITPQALIIFAIFLSALIYFLLTKLSQRKRAAQVNVQPERTIG